MLFRRMLYVATGVCKHILPTGILRASFALSTYFFLSWTKCASSQDTTHYANFLATSGSFMLPWRIRIDHNLCAYYMQF